MGVEFYPIVGKMSVPNQNTESVSFKVSLLKENGEKSEVRRFVVPQDCSSSLIYLKEKIRTIFNLGRSNCKVSWKDEDNDDVTIETDEELLIALQELVGPVYKLQVVKTEADFIPDHSNAGNGNTNQENQKQDGEVHYGVSCDGCDGPVQGFRYKCMVCPDFDLCSLCEAKGLHPGHNMIRIASPESIWPRHFMNRLHKMNARAARCHSAAASNETKKDDKKAEAGETNEGQNFGPWNWSARHGQRRGHGSHHRPRSAFGASNFAGTGSMDDPVVADVDFSDLSNLQANLHKHLSQHFGKHFGTPMNPTTGGNPSGTAAGTSSESSSGPSSSGMKAKEDSTTEAAAEAVPEAAPEFEFAEPPKKAATTPTEELSPRMRKVRDEMIKIHQQVHNLKIADVDGTDMVVIPVEETEVPIKKAKTDEQNSEQVAIPMPWKESMEASAPLTEVDESQAKKSDVEEWTILDKSNSPTPDKEMPKNTTTNDSPQQGAEALYPKLDDNATTTKIEETKIKNQIDLSKYSMKVQVAIQAMENMGFSNEDGWLSGLLDKYDGDIGKVLDLLQPVKPVRN